MRERFALCPTSFSLSRRGDKLKFAGDMNSANHNHQHAPNRFAVIPTSVRLNADLQYTGNGVTIAFLDSGFYPHPDLRQPTNRIIAYHDLTGDRAALDAHDPSESWQWHGTQTSIA